jgi:hemerythrin superfamily protein
MDAISLLKDDHRTVKELFRRFERAGDGAKKTKRALVDRIIEELSVHAAIEEEVFYPAVRGAAGETEEMVLESLEEHHLVKWTLWELERTQPDDERFDTKVSVLIENVRHHIQEEEGDLFKRVRAAVGRKDMRNLAERMLEVKKVAPRRPHPNAPDEPPANLVMNHQGAILDAGKEIASNVAQAARNVLPRGSEARSS